MAIVERGNYLILCLSGDTKPTKEDGWFLKETDTGKRYIRRSGVWEELETDSTGGGTPADTCADLTGSCVCGSVSAYSRGDHSHADTARHSNSNDHASGSDNQDLSGKVDKVTNYSLVADTEIAKIHANTLDHSNSNDHASGSDNQVIPDQLSDLTEDVTHRVVTDTEKSTWNAKGSSNLILGDLVSNAYYGDKGKTAYDHSQVAHAPSSAQVNADITKAEIEAKLTGALTSHSHAGGSGDVVGPASAVGDNIAVFNLTTGKLIKDGGATIASKENTGVAASAVSTHAALKTGVHGLLNSVRVKIQVTPTAKTAAVTLTIAELLTGIVTGTPAAAVAYTLPTGTLCEGGLTMAVNESFDWVLSNIATTATYIITLTAGTGHTIVGCAKIPSNSATTGGLWGTAAATFRTRKTATNTFVTYRIG